MAFERVKTTAGYVKGIPGERPGNTLFLGIPFAKAPVGALRFLAPQAPDPWEGERFCGAYASDCVQGLRPGDSFSGAEDCLYLNVFTPAETGSEKLPVLFWIYGGGFQGGRSSEPEFNGEALAAKGAVVVTINYRCNLFGFFSTKELEERIGFAGNAGLLDQILALKWVQDNIAAFGGDPDRVLIFGQSAGGISVRMLLASPLAKGLFSRAVVQSGGGLNEADLVRPKEDFQAMCQKCLDIAGLTVDDMLKKDSKEIEEKLCAAVDQLLQRREVGLFQPFVDGLTLTDVPGKSIARGEFSDVPVICGTVAGDSWMFSRKVRSQLDGIAYFRGFAISPGQAWGRRQLELGRAPIYTYYMDRTQPPKNESQEHGAPPFGASTPHSTEIAYLFGTLPVRAQAHTEFDYQLSEQMQGYWLNFAKSGDPNGEGLPQWPAFQADSRLTLHIGDEGIAAENIVHAPEEERVITYTMGHPGMLESLEGF